MDPVTPNTTQKDARATNEEGARSGPLTAAPLKSSGGKLPLISGAVPLLVYVLLLIVAVFTVYAWQNNQVKTAQKAEAAAVAQNEAKSKLPDESSNIETDKYQSVFLTGGQVYFGKIESLNPQFLTLTNVYYLRTSDQLQSGSAAKGTTTGTSLVKLGCELHGPRDKMVINRSELTFWENLKTDGQVASAIAAYQKENPNGQSCKA